MTLDPKYQKIFRKECDHLSQMILGSLQKLSENPTDKQELNKLVQAADTVMGGSRFLEDQVLEQNATMIVNSFTKIKDVRKKIDEYGAALEQFGLLVGKNGTCPKGYKLVNGKCILDVKPDPKNYRASKMAED
jgi:chemotaxis protein histidine kinase CheA